MLAVVEKKMNRKSKEWQVAYYENYELLQNNSYVF
jgi:hypothetical protein